MGLVEIPALAVLLTSCTATWTDTQGHRIPNWLTLGSLVGALCFGAYSASFAGVLRVLLGAAEGFALFLPFVLAGLVSGGDAKLMGVLGAWGGFYFMVETAFVGSAVSLIFLVLPWAVYILWRRHYGWIAPLLPEPYSSWVAAKSAHEPAERIYLPYGAAFALASMFVLWRVGM